MHELLISVAAHAFLGTTFYLFDNCYGGILYSSIQNDLEKYLNNKPYFESDKSSTINISMSPKYKMPR